jgi:regulator of sigma E protease
VGTFLLILGLLLFVGLVVVHEFGHFIMARRGGVDVEEFGLGFPPRIWKKRIHSSKGDFDFTVNLLPLGGFVRLKGENDADKRKGSFGAASLKVKTQIMAAGVVMNLLTAFAMLTVLAAIGMPKLIENQFTIKSDTKIVKQEVLVGYVEPGSPAEKTGLQVRDKLLSADSLSCGGTPQHRTYCSAIKTGEDLRTLTSSYAGSSLAFKYEHDGKIYEAVAQLRTTDEVEATKNTDNPKGYLGIIPTEYVVQRSTWSAPVVAAGLMKQVTVLTFKGLGNAIAGVFQGNGAKASEQVSGPVGIFVILKDGSSLGYQFMLIIIAIISLTLAIMNVLPIPALDGGRLFVTLVFRALRKPLTKTKEELIHGIGFMALMALFVLITVVDVKRFF